MVEAITNTNTSSTTATQLVDADSDTMIQVEESSDEDTIRMDIEGTEVLTLTNSAMTLKGTTPTLTIGDAGAEDTKIVFDGNAQDYYIGLDDSADDLIIGKGSTVGTTPAVIIDENLNVGIGATPKVTEAGWTNVSVGGQGALINSTSANAGGRTQLSNNVYVDESGNYSYISTDEASLYKQINGVHSWHNAASGSADAHITFTERMCIDTSGNVGIGVTDPASISGAAGEILEIAGSNPEIVWTDTAGTENSMSLYYLNNAMYVHNTESNDTSWYFKANGNVVMKGLNTTGSTSNRYPLYWVHTGTVGSLEPYTGSVRAMKTDIADMGSVDWIHSLTPKSFKFRDYTTDSEGNRTYLETTNDLPNTEYGLIAEEVDEVSGSDYILDKDADDNVKGVLYHNLVPILLKSIQELKTELDAAKARITTLEG